MQHAVLDADVLLRKNVLTPRQFRIEVKAGFASVVDIDAAEVVELFLKDEAFESRGGRAGWWSEDGGNGRIRGMDAGSLQRK